MRFSSDILPEFVRPVIKLDSVYKGCKALIDTGAEFAVWTAEEEALIKLGARKLDSTIILGGFGGKGEKCTLYRHTLIIGDIIFPDLLIAAGCKHINKFPLILPACMFQKFEMKIDFPAKRFTVNNMLNQVCYNYYVYDRNGVKHMLTQDVYTKSEEKTVLQDIVF